MSLDNYLKEVKARSEAATEGPWALHEDMAVEDCEWPDHLIGPRLGPSVAHCYTDSEKDLNNANFIAHARTDVPVLLEMVVTLLDMQGKLDKLESLVPKEGSNG